MIFQRTQAHELGLYTRPIAGRNYSWPFFWMKRAKVLPGTETSGRQPDAMRDLRRGICREVPSLLWRDPNTCAPWLSRPVLKKELGHEGARGTRTKSGIDHSRAKVEKNDRHDAADQLARFLGQNSILAVGAGTASAGPRKPNSLTVIRGPNVCGIGERPPNRPFEFGARIDEVLMG